VTFADLVAFSFVSGPDDIGRLHDELDRRGADRAGVILKIEHRAAFEYLPDMLIAAMRRPPAAVMVARGDLAVEVGYERLAEVQEEILWLCEAAHQSKRTPMLRRLSVASAPYVADWGRAAARGEQRRRAPSRGEWVLVTGTVAPFDRDRRSHVGLRVGAERFAGAPDPTRDARTPR
jgi:hypothetical protein